MAGNKNPKAIINVKPLKNFHIINDDYFQGHRKDTLTEIIRTNILTGFESKDIQAITKNEEAQKCIDETVDKVMYEIDNLKVYLKLQKGLEK